MRNRKNIDCLSNEELHELREGLSAMYAAPASDPNSFARIAGFHGGPPTAYCRHGSPGFFTWHRAYLMAFENALRTFSCDVTLPYWDWSSGPSTGVPEACRQPTYANRSGDTVANPLYSGPRSGGGQTSLRADIDTTTFDDLATSAQAAMSAATFTSFQNQVNGVHGGVHVRTGGDMASVPTASYDPIFYLHHANVDRLWAQWQVSHPGLLPASEASFELQPFNRPFSVQWQHGSDVESASALGYRYLRFCFFLPPIIIWEVIQIDWPWQVRRQMSSARLLIKSQQMQNRSVEVRAFFDQPQANARTKTIGNPAFAGAIGLFGHGEARGNRASAEECAECAKLGHAREHAHHGQTHHEHLHNSHRREAVGEERIDLELNLTEGVLAADRDKEQVSLKLVAVGENGEEVPARDILLEEVVLEVE